MPQGRQTVLVGGLAQTLDEAVVPGPDGRVQGWERAEWPRADDVAKENGLSAARFTAIGAFSDATLGYFDMEKKEYEEIPVDEQVEVLSLVGDIALFEGEPKLHAHAVLGRSDGTTRGGHLLGAHVQPTLEVVIVESPEHLRRETDEETGLPLLAVRD